MSSKKQDLIAQAKQTVRTPSPERLQPGRQKPGYRVVAVSLYTPEADWIDEVTKSLQLAGNPKANRSLVVREAIQRLREALQQKDPHEIFNDFSIHAAQRAQKAL